MNRPLITLGAFVDGKLVDSISFPDESQVEYWIFMLKGINENCVVYRKLPVIQSDREPSCQK